MRETNHSAVNTDRTNKRMDLLDEWMLEGTNKWIDGWMILVGWLNEWMNEW